MFGVCQKLKFYGCCEKKTFSFTKYKLPHLQVQLNNLFDILKYPCVIEEIVNACKLLSIFNRQNMKAVWSHVPLSKLDWELFDNDFTQLLNSAVQMDLLINLFAHHLMCISQSVDLWKAKAEMFSSTLEDIYKSHHY